MATKTTRRPAPAGRRARAEPRAGRPFPAAAPGATSVDSLAALWLTALEAYRSALGAGGRILGPAEAGRRSALLSVERIETMRVLQGLDRDLHAHSRLVPWLAAQAVTPRMLGLPADVVACVFDLDGVLTTSADVHAAAWTETLDPFLLEQADRRHLPFAAFDRRHEYPELLAGRSRLEGLRAFLAGRGIRLADGSEDDPPGTETVHGLANRKAQLLRQQLARHGVAAFEGSRCYLEAAGVVGLGRAVVSPSAHTAQILAGAGLTGLVEARVDALLLESEGLRPKPAPDTLLAACALLRVEPSQAAAFETSRAGIAAARAAGMGLVLGVDRTGEADVLWAGDPDRVVGDLAELLAETAG